MTEMLSVEKLEVQIHPTRAQMGKSAAMEAGGHIREVLSRQPVCNIIFAAEPSQNELLQGLRQAPGGDWSRVNAYHMDEYIGLTANAPQRFGHFLYEAIFKWLPFQCVSYINGNAESIEAECERYAGLFADHPPDICFMGIGENGHIAFNDPSVADIEGNMDQNVLWLRKFGQPEQRIDLGVIPDRFAGHGGDALMMNSLCDLVACGEAESLTSIDASVESHVMALAAEKARITGRTVVLDEFTREA